MLLYVVGIMHSVKDVTMLSKDLFYQQTHHHDLIYVPPKQQDGETVMSGV